MKAQVFSDKELIGTTKLQVGDVSMGHVFGKFLPNQAYYEHIQKLVWEINSRQLKHFNWQSLNLNVQLENEFFLFAAGGITFDEINDLPEKPIQIDIAGVDRYVIEEFFLHEQPRSFVIEPWEGITIGQKITFEEELKLETKDDSTRFFNFLSSDHDIHILANCDAFAICTDGRNDDVLFRIVKSGFDKHFAIVHLTWIGKKESKGFPKVEFYESFDYFKQLRMYPDNSDWEY